MRKNLFSLTIPFITLVVVLFAGRLQAQVTQSTISYGSPHLINFHERALYDVAHPQALKKRAIEQGEDRAHYKFVPKPVPPGATAQSFDLPAAKALAAAAAVNSPAASLNINGVLDNGTLIPPDINGAVGSTYVMETTNQEFRIYTKAGALNSTVTITTFFSATGGSGYYDPHIVFDPNNNRYIICIDGNASNGDGGLFLAVSQTGDPTGNWYTYGIDALGNATDFLDYPQMGFNNNWVVLTGNDFLAAGGNVGKIYVFNRASVYSGSAGTLNTFTDNTASLISPAATYDASQNTEYLVTDWNGSSGGNGYVRLSTITGTASAPAYTTGSTIGVNQPWSETAVNAPQLGSTNLIEDGDTRIHSCIYRNSSLWFTHSVFLPATTPTYAASDWWQINPAAATVTQFGRIADPAGKIFYYYPSLDVNTNGDMLIGYSMSGPSNYASAEYALHLSTDAVNTLETPVLFKAGVAGYFKDYGGGRNRWGDFSGTAFDPSDNTFWTFQEWANTGNNWATQIAHIPDSGGTAPCAIPTGSATSNITDTTARFTWTAVSGALSYNVRYRQIGASTWITVSDSLTVYNVVGLTAGTNYEWQVQTVCSSTSSSSFTASTNFTTTGGCAIPGGLAASAITNTTATLGWNAVTGSTSYTLQWKDSLVTTWTTVTGLTAHSYNLTGLTAAHTYQFKVQTICGSGSSAYSNPASFITTGGSLTYCASGGNTTYEYVKTVLLGSINHTSTNDGGYGNFTSVQTSLAAGSNYTIKLTPGFTGSSYREYWTVYIDYNQNGVLNDAGEIVATGNGTGAVSKAFTVPTAAKNGATRMRIQLHYGSSNTNPCATLDYGDVQDYTVVITGGTAPVEGETTPALTTVEETDKSGSDRDASLKIVPNPVPGSQAPTAIYRLVREGNVSMKIIDLGGRVLHHANLGVQNAGPHNYLLSGLGNRLAAGYYIIVLEQNKQIVARTRFIVK